CRPLPNSPFLNFFVAGDWTDTGWPANLESAILSGQRCAEAIPA
ncbi:MAG: FAD-dependent oxidoreductase, partial [Nitrospira sp.]|nr:FAD-dependent oxidoreductase [Nitrospira sp.]